MGDVVLDIREVGPRDGLQLEAPLDFAAKERLITALANTGVRRIEATAFVSPTAVPSMAEAERIGELVQRWPGIQWSALVPNPRGAHRALAAGFRNVEYVISASDSHSVANVRRPTALAASGVSEVARLVHDAGGTLEVIIATAWDCPFEGPTPLSRVVEIVERALGDGADEICIADTIGTVVPYRVIDLITAIRSAAPGVELGAHFHNTRGTGIASAWAALQTGIRKLDASAGGLGGCPFAPGATGNIATEELVYLVEGTDIASGVDLDSVLAAARLTQELVGHPVDSSLLRAGGRSAPRGVVAEQSGERS